MKSRSKVGNRRSNPAYRTPAHFRGNRRFQLSPPKTNSPHSPKTAK